MSDDRFPAHRAAIPKAAAPVEDWSEQEKPQVTIQEAPRTRGRPKGARNKPKVVLRNGSSNIAKAFMAATTLTASQRDTVLTCLEALKSVPAKHRDHILELVSELMK